MFKKNDFGSFQDSSSLDKKVRQSTQELVNDKEGELRKSEERYRQMVENANDIIYRTDTNGNITFCNPDDLQDNSFIRFILCILSNRKKPLIYTHYSTPQNFDKFTTRLKEIEMKRVKPFGSLGL